MIKFHISHGSGIVTPLRNRRNLAAVAATALESFWRGTLAAEQRHIAFHTKTNGMAAS